VKEGRKRAGKGPRKVLSTNPKRKMCSLKELSSTHRVKGGREEGRKRADTHSQKKTQSHTHTHTHTHTLKRKKVKRSVRATPSKILSYEEDTCHI